LPSRRSNASFLEVWMWNVNWVILRHMIFSFQRSPLECSRDAPRPNVKKIKIMDFKQIL
jgi:hypothetical protein